jgi:hypothetical protein
MPLIGCGLTAPWIPFARSVLVFPAFFVTCASFPSLQPLPVYFHAKVNFLRLKQVKLLLRYAVMGVMVAGFSCTAISLR